MSKVFGPGKKQQRFVPYSGQAGACSLKVPLEVHPNGQMFEGRFQIPARLGATEPHTNDHLEFIRLCKENYDRWVEWRAQKGWYVVEGSLMRTEPYPNPTPNSWTEGDPETMTVSLFARFKRNSYLYIGLDDQLEIERMYALYGLEKPSDALPYNDVTGSEDTGWVNPVEHALKRKERLGIKPEEHIIEKWREAELNGHEWSPN